MTGWEERGRRRSASLSVRAVEAVEREMGRAWFDYFELEAARQASWFRERRYRGMVARV